jgi:hypothetical protein
MGTGTIRSPPGLGHEENIGVKNSHATGENSSVDRNRISDFMGKRRVELHRTTHLPFGHLSHGAEALIGETNPMGFAQADRIRPLRAGSRMPSADTLGIPVLAILSDSPKKILYLIGRIVKRY